MLTATPPAEAEPSVGEICPGPNATAKYSGREWICVQKGAKLTWQLKNWAEGDAIYNWVPSGNLVTATIQRRISKLRKVDQGKTSKIRIEHEGKVPIDALKSLRNQVSYMLQAYPEVFGSFNNRVFIYQTPEWARKKAIANKCPVPSNVDNPPPQSPHSQSVPCNFDLKRTAIGSFMNWTSFEKYDPAPTRQVGGFDEWANQFAQEGGGASIQSFYNKSAKLGNGNPLPAWYEQGGQNMFTSIALAIQTRKWRQASLFQGRASNCGGFDIAKTEFYGPDTKYCEYDLGAIGNELLIALSGFDGPIAWYKVAEIKPGTARAEVTRIWRSTFKDTFGLELTQFYQWANAYGRYMVTDGRTNLPSDLVKKLEQVRG